MKKWDIHDTNSRTRLQINRLDDYKKFFADTKSEQRLKEQECVICYYSTRLEGQAFTHSTCKSCFMPTMFSTTDIDLLCKGCAEKEGLCKHCGADINYQDRRR